MFEISFFAVGENGPIYDARDSDVIYQNPQTTLPWTNLPATSDDTLPFSTRTFDSVVQQCKLPQQPLEAFEHCTLAGFCSRFTTTAKADGKISSTSA